MLARYPYLRIIAGPGAGPTPAIKLGYASATGDFVIEVNSDDRLLRGSIARLVECARARPEIRIWTGGVRIFKTGPDGTEVTLRTLSSRATTELSFANVLDDLPLCNSRFFHRSVLADLDAINLDFPESSDREMVLRALMAGVPEAYLEIVVAELRVHSGSHTLHRFANSIPPYIAEHVQLAEFWLARPDLTPMAKAKLKNWRAREILRLAAFTWRVGMRWEAISLVTSAIRRDPAWSLRALSAFSAWRLRRRA